MSNYTQILEKILMIMNRLSIGRLIVLLAALIIWKTESLKLILDFMNQI